LLSLKRCLTCILELDVKEREKLKNDENKSAESDGANGEGAADGANGEGAADGATNSTSGAVDGAGGGASGGSSSSGHSGANGADVAPDANTVGSGDAGAGTTITGGTNPNADVRNEDFAFYNNSLNRFPGEPTLGQMPTGPIGPFEEDRVPFYDSKLTMIMKDALLSNLNPL
jgi:hypothetical protein